MPADAKIKESWTAPEIPKRCAPSSKAGIRASAGCCAAVGNTFRWALYDREPLPKWTKGRLTLLGDAAHPMLPHLGQGANQSIEDGMALATIWRNRTRELPEALVAYEHCAASASRQVQLGARGNGMRDDSSYADLGERDAEIAAHAPFRRQLYAYDVVPEARAVAAALS